MTKTQLPSLYKFWRMLRNHDWTFDYSDDHSVWRRGQLQLSKIKDVVEVGGAEYKELFDEYSSYAWRKDNSIQEPVRPLRTKEEQLEDMEMLTNIAESLELTRDEIFSIEHDQINSATDVWKILNPIQSMLYHIRNLVDDKNNSNMNNIIAYKGYKKLKQELDKLLPN